MFVFGINDIVLIDGSKFVTFYADHVPNFTGVDIESLLNPKAVDEDYLTIFGYLLNVKATVHRDLNAHELESRLLDLKLNFNSIFTAFFNLEIYNYHQFAKGSHAYFFPSLDFIKFVFWNYEAKLIPDFKNSINKINAQILKKSTLVMPNLNIGSQSTTSPRIRTLYLDLLDTTSDLTSELMIASLCHLHKYQISDGGTHDFIINLRVFAEVKSIHDKILVNDMQVMSNLIQKNLPASFTLDDLRNTILSEILREKWIYHLDVAISKQQGDIVFFNVTQSPGLYEILLYLEQSGNKRSFKETIADAMLLRNNKDSVPIVVMMENIHLKLSSNFFSFTAPVKFQNNKKEFDRERYNEDYLAHTIKC